MTEEELKNAIELHDSGMSWSIVAAYLKTTTDKLRKELKHYEKTNQ